MKNENLLVAELKDALKDAEAAKSRSDKKISSLKKNLSAERKNNKALCANVNLIKERIKNAENAELREYLDQNGVLISDVFAAVKDGKIPKSAAEKTESAESSGNDAPAEIDNDEMRESIKSVTSDTNENEEEAV